MKSALPWTESPCWLLAQPTRLSVCSRYCGPRAERAGSDAVWALIEQGYDGSFNGAAEYLNTFGKAKQDLSTEGERGKDKG